MPLIIPESGTNRRKAYPNSIKLIMGEFWNRILLNACFIECCQCSENISINSENSIQESDI